jgi:alcohol dehydrogenase YqhD (iron-dependent ADH family)
MRFLYAVLALAGTETALAHTPGTGFLADLGHQLTSLHHLPAAVLLAVLITLLVLVTRRNRSSR